MLRNMHNLYPSVSVKIRKEFKRVYVMLSKEKVKINTLCFSVNCKAKEQLKGIHT